MAALESFWNGEESPEQKAFTLRALMYRHERNDEFIIPDDAAIRAKLSLIEAVRHRFRAASNTWVDEVADNFLRVGFRNMHLAYLFNLSEATVQDLEGGSIETINYTLNNCAAFFRQQGPTGYLRNSRLRDQVFDYGEFTFNRILIFVSFASR